MIDQRRGIAQPITITVRPQIASFALAMEAKLQERDDRKHWNTIDEFDLFDLLEEEVEELGNAMAREGFPRVEEEAVDVANYALFFFDNARMIGQEAIA